VAYRFIALEQRTGQTPALATDFPGPNGAGKSTAMRLIVGLDTPSSATALVNGKHDTQHRAPLREL